MLLVVAVATALTSVLLLQRMSAVTRRAVAPAVAAPVGAPAAVQDVALASDRVAWTPRELPRPLTASAGSRAATVLDEVDAAPRCAGRRSKKSTCVLRVRDGCAPPGLDQARARGCAAGAR